MLLTSFIAQKLPTQRQALTCAHHGCSVVFNVWLESRSQGLRHMHADRLAAFVGEDLPGAGEYHDADFTWEEHFSKLEDVPDHILEDVEEARRGVKSIHDSEDETCRARQKGGRMYDDTSWEAFHTTENSTARFYKERRYLLFEFPELLRSEPPQHIVEIGCGVGSSILPVLKANATCKATTTDLSPTAVRLLNEAAVKAGIAPERIHSFDLDAATVHHAPNPFLGLEADGLLLIFTLAALPPSSMPAMLENAFQALRPGGLLFLRDHGVLDLTHRRLPQSRKLAHRLYRRGDGTTCYFFTPADVGAKLMAAGFEVLESKYVCVDLKNRKANMIMKRVFVHGVFRKPSV